MANKDKIFGVDRFEGGSSFSDMREVELPQGELVKSEFQVGEDIASLGNACELLFRVHVWDFSGDDDISVKLNDQPGGQSMTNKYNWTCVTSDVPWSPRDGAQLVSFQDKLFLLGGWNQYAEERPDLAGEGAGSFESEVCSEVWCSDDDGGSWGPWWQLRRGAAGTCMGALCTMATSGSSGWRTGPPTTCGSRRMA